MKLLTKKLLLTSLVASCLLTTHAFAESDDAVRVPAAPNLSLVSSVTENREEIKITNNLTKGKQRASNLIDERIKVLSNNIRAVGDNKNLTTEQKAILTGSLASTTLELTKLKTMIASSTDATSTKILIESIFKDFRVYGIVIPRERLDARIYQLKNHSSTLSSAFSKLQTKIDDNKGKGNDTTSWQKGLDDAKVLIAQDMFKLDELLKKTATLTPAHYGTTSKAIIDSINKDIKLVAKDFNTIVSKVRKPYSMKKLHSFATSTPDVSDSVLR
jgi:hypothetical protein